MAPRECFEEVPVLKPTVVQQIRALADRGWGSKRISRELGVARNTVRRYLRAGDEALVQERPLRRRMAIADTELARRLFSSIAEGNAVVVRRELNRAGISVGVRTVQRVVRPLRQAKLAADVAAVRFETAPGQQLQVDFGQKWVEIAGTRVRVYFLVAVLGYSRRIFVRPFLAERGDDWREGIAAAFEHFGGVTAEVLGDNARALVLFHNRAAQTVTFHPAYLAFCRDWGVVPRACAPYRARTKGKTESGVKYVKRNAIAGRSFASFEALGQHLEAWMYEADRRIHGTLGEAPVVRFERDERHALRPLPGRPLAARVQRLTRRVANDALVNFDTVRYSVPHRLVREVVELAVDRERVRVLCGGQLVADHARSFEPFTRVVDPAHYEGLWRVQSVAVAPEPSSPSPLAAMGRTLAAYAEVVS